MGGIIVSNCWSMPSPHTPEELHAWLRLSLEPGLRPADVLALLAVAGLPEQIYDSAAAALAKVVPAELARQLAAPPAADTAARIEAGMAWAASPGHGIVTLADPGYPKPLLNLPDPPPLLYVAGDPEFLGRAAIAVVGARSATAGGLDNARAFSRHLAAQGWCVVSGLARGIDAAAHEGALEAGPAGGGTIAVLGTGIDIVYPSSNRDLAARIGRHGALVSEFPLGTPPLPHQFPRRNRVVAGLARGVLVVEAARQSGSLSTARLAAESGREVFAIPGSIHSPLSRGCHALIRQGAKLVETAQDIADELGVPGTLAKTAAGTNTGAGADAGAGKGARANPDPRARNSGQRGPAPSAAAQPPHPLLDAVGYDPVSFDVLQARTGLDAAELQAQLLELELDGRIARLDGGRFQRA